MVFKKCPGQDLSRKKIEDVVSEILCCFCGTAVEFFFDDLSRICPECGSLVEKCEERVKKDFKCAVWCDAASDCLGSDVLPILTKKNDKIEEDLFHYVWVKLRK